MSCSPLLQDVISAHLDADPDFAREYQRIGKERAKVRRLVERRQSAGISQRAMATQLGVSQAWISMLERDALIDNPEAQRGYSAAIRELLKEKREPKATGPRTESVVIRVTPEEKAALEEAAGGKGMVARFVRSRCLSAARSRSRRSAARLPSKTKS